MSEKRWDDELLRMMSLRMMTDCSYTRCELPRCNEAH